MSSEAPRPSAFALAIETVRIALGRHRGAIDDGWFGPPGPNGGVIAAHLLGAIRSELDDAERMPRSLTPHYLRPPPPAPDVPPPAEVDPLTLGEGTPPLFQRLGGRLLAQSRQLALLRPM